jgi:hypothetical protein
MPHSTPPAWTAAVEPFVSPLVSAARDFTDLTGVHVRVREELFLRRQFMGLRTPGRTSANGSCHLVRTLDGWAAVNLARPDDVAAVPALLALVGDHRPYRHEPVAQLREAAAGTMAADIADGAQLLGIPAAALGSERGSRQPVVRTRCGQSLARRDRPVRVVDFSALWAGPLCARLLGLAGAQVTHVESRERPDGTRQGSPALYRRLRAGHRNLVLDFAPAVLREVVADADVVIEASRPRALRRLGLHAEEFLADRPGRVWVGITGYGRDVDRVAFGDDAAVAGGLVGEGSDGAPAFLGDALADPVTGILAARAVAGSLAAGGGDLLCVSMAACAAALAEDRSPAAS